MVMAWDITTIDRFAASEPEHDPGRDLLGRIRGLQRLVAHHQDPADEHQQHVAGVGDRRARWPTWCCTAGMDPGCGVDRALCPISVSSGLTADLTSAANQLVIALVT